MALVDQRDQSYQVVLEVLMDQGTLEMVDLGIVQVNQEVHGSQAKTFCLVKTKNSYNNKKNISLNETK